MVASRQSCEALKKCLQFSCNSTCIFSLGGHDGAHLMDSKKTPRRLVSRGVNDTIRNNAIKADILRLHGLGKTPETIAIRTGQKVSSILEILAIPPKEKPLFIPLKREYFEDFKWGVKHEEYRPYGPRWSPKNCRIGRKVVLSLGYGKSDRLTGVIIDFRREPCPSILPGWSACYGNKHNSAACIGIKLDSEAVQ